MDLPNPVELLRPGRKIQGVSAILLPFDQQHEVDWGAFDAHVQRTAHAGLRPAINMDTGYANLIDDGLRQQVLQRTHELVGEEFVAGVFVQDGAGASWDADAYRRGTESIVNLGGQPIFFQSFGLVSLGDEELVDAYQRMAQDCSSCLFFELGTMFAPFGRIYSLPVYEQLMRVPQMAGAKHSSLDRRLEWQRLQLRDRVRPDFHVYTGNDLAIDMVMYGSDYLLGLSTFAPEAFALRDRLWERGDAGFYALNDLLQYLGAFTFRGPVSAYKHSAAMFLNLRGQIATDLPHPQAPTRPPEDRAVLRLIARDLERMIQELS